MTEILATIFIQTEADEIDKACYLSLGMLAPKFANLELNVAEKMMVRSISIATNHTPDQITAMFKQTGDLGEVTFNLLNQHHHQDSQLSIEQVYQQLIKVANFSGTGSQDLKINTIAKLIKLSDPLSAKYIVRIPIKKLRLGFSDMTILDALSWMQTKDKTLRKPLEAAFNVRADIGQIAKTFKLKGIETIQSIIPKPGTPIRPAKATPLLEPADILTKMDQQSLLEPKYDGFRVQIHLDKSRSMPLEEEGSLFAQDPKPYVQIFSRNLDNITYMFPELVEAVAQLNVESIILDGEAIAVDPQTGTLLDFQETIKRKRKHNIDQMAKDIPLNAFIFDLLYLNGTSYISTSLTKRRQALQHVFETSPQNDSLQVTPYKIVQQPDQFQQYFNDIAADGLEGVMAKKVNAPYRAGARDFTWVKFKVGMQTHMADTVDAVIMGYFKGQGKWAKFGLGKILIGLPNSDQIYSLSKVGSGLSEETIKELVNRLEKIKTDQPPTQYHVDKNLIPDVWVKPQQVIEIRADSISKSPIYTAGLSLRFPRFIRFRDDKSIEDATSIKELKIIAGEK